MMNILKLSALILSAFSYGCSSINDGVIQGTSSIEESCTGNFSVYCRKPEDVMANKPCGTDNMAYVKSGGYGKKYFLEFKGSSWIEGSKACQQYNFGVYLNKIDGQVGHKDTLISDPANSKPELIPFPFYANFEFIENKVYVRSGHYVPVPAGGGGWNGVYSLVR